MLPKRCSPRLPLIPPRFGDRVGAQTFTPNKTPVDLTVTVGSHGLGLILTEDKEGTRWGVKGFRVMPDGQNNPGKASRVESIECSAAGIDGGRTAGAACSIISLLVRFSVGVFVDVRGGRYTKRRP